MTSDLLRGAFERASIPAPVIEGELSITRGARAEDWWTMVMGSGYRPIINQLTDADREHVRSACLAIAAPTVAAPVLYAHRNKVKPASRAGKRRAPAGGNKGVESAV